MSGTNQISIMVVEDDGIIAFDIMIRLQELGYPDIEYAMSGEDALHYLSLHPVDLIFMDITLGGNMDGIQTAAAVRGRYGIPVVFLTAHSDISMREKAMDAGPAGYILKPFGDEDLQTAIERALSSVPTQDHIATCV
ncbi:response regulator [Methanofollis fontis]|uniref:Two-component system response regulator n=1 Tax=Methanofollis fontis TaxID=2052832 RepID=A0A483CNL7_9EURY|nr:response regulator [Methanofollis fontis]TAJ44590.1 two-component system response regulator [Methanofollis fontis]